MNLSYGSGYFLENQLISPGFIEKVVKSRPLMSALFGGSQSFTSVDQPFLINDLSDDIEIRYIKKSNFKPFNQFKIGDEYLDFKDNPDFVVNGFVKVYKVFQQNKNKIRSIILDEVNNTKPVVRHILRKTSLYSLIIQNMYQPSNWSLVDFKIEVNNFLNSLNKDIISVISYEINDLFKLDIPYFNSSLKEKNLICGDKKIKNFFRETPFERWERKLNILSGEHLNKKIDELRRLFISKK